MRREIKKSDCPPPDVGAVRGGVQECLQGDRHQAQHHQPSLLQVFRYLYPTQSIPATNFGFFCRDSLQLCPITMMSRSNLVKKLKNFLPHQINEIQQFHKILLRIIFFSNTIFALVLGPNLMSNQKVKRRQRRF